MKIARRRINTWILYFFDSRQKIALKKIEVTIYIDQNILLFEKVK